jgi:hypothetical protein
VVSFQFTDLEADNYQHILPIHSFLVNFQLLCFLRQLSEEKVNRSLRNSRQHWHPMSFSKDLYVGDDLVGWHNLLSLQNCSLTNLTLTLRGDIADTPSTHICIIFSQIPTKPISLTGQSHTTLITPAKQQHELEHKPQPEFSCAAGASLSLLLIFT